jgi:hypothetical protein
MIIQMYKTGLIFYHNSAPHRNVFQEIKFITLLLTMIESSWNNMPWSVSDICLFRLSVCLTVCLRAYVCLSLTNGIRFCKCTYQILTILVTLNIYVLKVSEYHTCMSIDWRSLNTIPYVHVHRLKVSEYHTCMSIDWRSLNTIRACP